MLHSSQLCGEKPVETTRMLWFCIMQQAGSGTCSRSYSAEQKKKADTTLSLTPAKMYWRAGKQKDHFFWSNSRLWSQLRTATGKAGKFQAEMESPRRVEALRNSPWSQCASLHIQVQEELSFSVGSSSLLLFLGLLPLRFWMQPTKVSESFTRAHITHPHHLIRTTGVSQCPVLYKCNPTSASVVYSTFFCCINNLFFKIYKNQEENIP